MATNLTKYDLPSNAYLGFDAQNLNELIIQKLNEGGNFTDQIYEGSNFSALLDVTAYAYHLLLFYLNKMGAEATYTQTQLYENINRLVKIIGFKPIGYQTSCVSFNVSVNKNNLEHEYLYTIPRFAYINVNGIKYSLTKYINFSVTNNEEDNNGTILLREFSDSNILFQGEVIEHDLYSAKGDKFETFTLIPANLSLKEQTIYVDHANFSVFVYNGKTQVWEEYTETSSLYLENSTSLKYEKRLNEAGYYEFRFGNNVHGRKLESGDVVQVYYLKSDGTSGEIGINQLNGNVLNLYRTNRFLNIMSDISITSIDTVDVKYLQFSNDTPSTKFTLPEDVETIRTNSGKVFRSNSQLITSENIQTHIERNFSNIISSCYVLDNKTYLNDVMSYYYRLGLDSINLDSRIAFNQVQFSTSCNFNNVYVYMVPKYTPVNDNNVVSYVDSNLKQYIVTRMENDKPLTTEIVPMDPVYMAVGFAVQNIEDTIFTEPYSTQTPDTIIDETKIVLTRFSNSHNKTSAIKAEACDIIKNIFSESKLGYTIPLAELNNMLLNINGIKSVHTERNGVVVNGLSLMVWNPVYYNKDIRVTTNNITFEKFKYPFLYNSSKLENYIDVVIE